MTLEAFSIETTRLKEVLDRELQIHTSNVFAITFTYLLQKQRNFSWEHTNPD